MTIRYTSREIYSVANGVLVFGALQWLESLDKKKREEKLQETMHLIAEGIIKPPRPSAPPRCTCSRCHLTWPHAPGPVLLK